MAHLLLVDDSPEVTLIVQRLGRRAGHEVSSCTDLTSPLEFLRHQTPDLILLDFNLPGARGDALCRRLRAELAWRQLPIALFAHWHQPEDIAAALAAGIDFVIFKDLLLTPAAWERRLSECLAPRSRRLQGPHLSCPQGAVLPRLSAAIFEAMNRTLRHPLSRALGEEVLRLVLRRAVEASLPPSSAAGWLTADGLRLDVAFLAQAVRPEDVAAFTAALAEQMACLLGAEAGAPFQEALAAALTPADPLPAPEEAPQVP